MKKRLYIANWKMTVEPSHAHTFYHTNHDELCRLAEYADIVLCPSFVALGALAKDCIHEPAVQLGGQNCSEHAAGPFTGQVSALSLQEVGCTYCIIGHSERRTHCGETDTQIARKMEQLFVHNIVPIACIGETKKAHTDGNISAILESQLQPLLAVCKKNRQLPVVFAYEPVWAIGTGITPKPDQLQKIISWIHETIYTHIPEISAHIVYGGSVNEKTVQSLKSLQHLDGFLIGSASSDFQTFKNIVL